MLENLFCLPNLTIWAYTCLFRSNLILLLPIKFNVSNFFYCQNRYVPKTKFNFTKKEKQKKI